MKPLGRDRLGRLVYDGDFVHEHRRNIVFKVRKILVIVEDNIPKYSCGLEAKDAPYWIDTERACGWLEECELDFSMSPKRTNYERYFADLETIDCIGELINDDCCAEEGYRFWNDFASCVCHRGAGYWLQQEATV